MAPTTPDPDATEKAKYKAAVDRAQDAIHKLWKNGGKDRELSKTLHAGLQSYYQKDSARGRNNVKNAIKGIGGYNGDPEIISAVLAIFDLDRKKLHDWTHGFMLPNNAAKDVHDNIGPSLEDIPGVGALTNPLDWLKVLTDKNTWLRVGEALVGLLLIGIGVAAVTKGTPIGSAIRKGTKVVTKI